MAAGPTTSLTSVGLAILGYGGWSAFTLSSSPGGMLHVDQPESDSAGTTEPAATFASASTQIPSSSVANGNSPVIAATAFLPGAATDQLLFLVAVVVLMLCACLIYMHRARVTTQESLRALVAVNANTEESRTDQKTKEGEAAREQEERVQAPPELDERQSLGQEKEQVEEAAGEQEERVQAPPELDERQSLGQEKEQGEEAAGEQEEREKLARLEGGTLAQSQELGDKMAPMKLDEAFAQEAHLGFAEMQSTDKLEARDCSLSSKKTQGSDSEGVEMEGNETLLKVELPAHAYPRDEPMQHDMSDYRKVLEPDLSVEDRALLNAAREAQMSGETSSASVHCHYAAESGRGFVDTVVDLLRNPPIEDLARQAWETTQALNMGIGLLQVTMTGLTRIPQLIDDNIAIINVVMWIIVLEILHTVCSWFSRLGLIAMTALLQGLTSLFLLRCYYALVVRTSDPGTKFPAIQALRRLAIVALAGLRSPGCIRPPVLRMIFLARVIRLLQLLCNLLLPVLSMRMDAQEILSTVAYIGCPSMEVLRAHGWMEKTSSPAWCGKLTHTEG